MADTDVGTPPRASNDRLTSINRLLTRKGVPQEVIRFANRPQRISTASLYDKQWLSFSSYCAHNKLDPFTMSEGQIAQYLKHLYDKGLLPATIRVHRAALSSVLKHTHIDISNSVIINDMLKRFELERPRVKRVLPQFDINLVLRQLLKPPFVDANGSDMLIPLPLMAYKLAFLLALATGSRASELHALSRASGRFKIDRSQDGRKTLTIHTHPGFLAKNARPTVIQQPFVIPSMKQMVGPREPERLWCPVRAVEAYISRTPDGAFSVEDTRLLRHPISTIRTTKGHVSMWIRNTIKEAYSAAGKDTDTVHNRAHEVRAIAHSLVAYDGATIAEVLEGGRWRSSGSFYQHYLRDVATSVENLNAPIVVAGKVLQPRP